MQSELTKPPEKRLIFDVNPFMTTVVLTENDRAVEIFTEKSCERNLAGSIYKGVVQSILPGISAAFVNIGVGRNAILHFKDIRIDRTSEGGGKYELLRKGESPTDFLKVGSEILVQASKEPIGTKGPKVTMELTLPGHTLVLLPASKLICMSKRFRSEDNKNRIREILKAHIPPCYGVIARSESELIDEAHLSAELEMIIKRWEDIEHRGRISTAPKLIWGEEDIVSRSVRDLMRSDVAELAINSYEEYVHIRSMLMLSTPHLVDRVRLVENEPDLLERFNINKQLSDALSRRVWLKSGAYIVIDKTEALTSIDVNTGKNTGSSCARNTILETNREAAVEIAKQIRLRNLGGIIVIDFIDMNAQEEQNEIVNTLKRALSTDPARPTVYGMTRLGLVELARRRSGKSLEEIYMQKCRRCDGSGAILSPEHIALKLYKRVSELIEEGNKQLHVFAAPAVISEFKAMMDRCDDKCGLENASIRYHADVMCNPTEFQVKLHG